MIVPSDVIRCHPIDHHLQTQKGAECLLVDLGCQNYQESLRFRPESLKRRKQNNIPDCLLFVEYGHTITVGRSGNEDHLLVSKRDLEKKEIQLCHTDRGGDITYHGPGQLIAYPILDLKSLRRDIDWYLRTLEACLMATLEDFGIVSRTIPGAHGCVGSGGEDRCDRGQDEPMGYVTWNRFKYQYRSGLFQYYSTLRN